MGKQNWIAATSINVHLTSQAHLKAVDRRNGEKAVRERLAEEHCVESQQVSHDQQPTNLRRVKITEPTPSFGSKPPNQPPNAFWNLYDEDFMVERDMGEVQKETLEQEVRQGFDSWKLNMFQESRVQLDLSMMDDEAELELLAMIQGADVDEEEQVDPLSVKVDPATQWFPYESETNFLLVLKALRVKDVPSLKRLRAFQESLRKESGIPTMPCKSFQGNVFHMNDPRAIIAKDWTDPDIRRHLHVYPEIPEDGIISEVWHADKWRKEMDLRHLSPMYDANGIHYYVFEVAQLQDKSYIVPIRWLMYKGHIYADAFKVNFDWGKAVIQDDIAHLIPAANLEHNFLNLQDTNSVPLWDDVTISKGYPAEMPNPNRALAEGDPLYSSFFGNDVSGNRSKSWNKHWNSYITHRNLPRRLLFQEYNVHFISTSPNASISEQFHTFKKIIE
ncbi:hypothetical protein PQX77_016734 [Marasmius sp. AFHP31]|nr:hypothetical protein PQX77_016734 [Marasmius sp. AFHP31]